VPSEVLNRPVRVQHHVRNIAARHCEVRRVCEVESLEAELELVALFHHEIAGNGEIHVGDAGPAQRIEAGVAEAQPGDWLKRQRIEIGYTGADATEDIHT